MTVSNNTIAAEGLGNFFKDLGEEGMNGSKEIAKSGLKNPGRALEIGANFVTAFAFGSLKAALSTSPQVINFYHADK